MVKSKRKLPTNGTINRELGLINEWFNNYLIPKGYARFKPSSLKRALLDYDELSAYPPIPLKELEMVWRWMDRCTKHYVKGFIKLQVERCIQQLSLTGTKDNKSLLNDFCCYCIGNIANFFIA